MPWKPPVITRTANGVTRREYPNGTIRYDGPDGFHREDGPAEIRPDGVKRWWLNGRLHREDGPAQEDPDGTGAWWLHGEYHRADGPAYEDRDGSQYWYWMGKRHRAGGPAVDMANGWQEWWTHGKFNRHDIRHDPKPNRGKPEVNFGPVIDDSDRESVAVFFDGLQVGTIERGDLDEYWAASSSIERILNHGGSVCWGSRLSTVKADIQECVDDMWESVPARPGKAP